MRGAVGLTALFKDKRYQNDRKIIENDRELKTPESWYFE